MPLTLYLLLTFSTSVLCIVLIGSSILLAMAGFILIRWIVPLDEFRADRDVAGTLLTVIGTTYAVLIAFMVFIAWTQFEEANRRVEHEANEVASLIEDARGLPETTRSALLQQLHEYARVVVDEEWSLMARGQESRRAWEALQKLWQILHKFEPQTARENLFYAESLNRLNLLGDYRRLRLLSSRGEVPRILWILLVLGGGVTVAFTYFFGVKSLWVQGVMTGVLAGMLAFILTLILLLEHPFSGDLRISPEAFKQVLKHLEEVHPPSPVSLPAEFPSRRKVYSNLIVLTSNLGTDTIMSEVDREAQTGQNGKTDAGEP